MRIFVTGASGFIGSAVVPELISAGHRVLGLARSDESAAAVEAAGAEVQRGSLAELDSLRAGAEASEGVIHLAFIHDFNDYATSAAADREAIEAMGEVLTGTDRPLVVAAGVLGIIPPGQVLTEEDRPRGPGARFSEPTALALAEQGVRAAAVRLAPTVHSGADRHGFVPTLIEVAREKGFSGYLGDGANRWPAVHQLDAARLFRLALESAPAGSAWHGVAEEGVPTREIAAAIGRLLDLPVRSVDPDQALDHFGWIGRFFGADAPTSTMITRERLGWEPTGPTLAEDLASGSYPRAAI